MKSNTYVFEAGDVIGLRMVVRNNKIIGGYGVPPEGGYAWFTLGWEGECSTEYEALAEITKIRRSDKQ